MNGHNPPVSIAHLHDIRIDEKYSVAVSCFYNICVAFMILNGSLLYQVGAVSQGGMGKGYNKQSD